MSNWKVENNPDCKSETLILETRNGVPTHSIKVVEHTIFPNKYSAIYTIPDQTNKTCRNMEFWIQINANNMAAAKLEAITVIKKLVSGIISDYQGYYDQIEEAVSIQDMVELKNNSENQDGKEG
ncbi:MAG: hypothetical protein IJ419_10845 [Agathobacter sp.]|nr:hypothetical protein [Agathobacter sp.]